MSVPIWPLQTPAELNARFGNPDANGDGRPDPAWEAANIVAIPPVYPMRWAFDTDGDGKLDDPVKSIRVHRLAAPFLIGFFQQVSAFYGDDLARIQGARMDVFGGCYTFRRKRGGTSLSTHSWGVAWDMDPERNPFRTPYRPGYSIPMPIVALAKEQGAVWGGDWTPADAMHFQFARIR